MATESPHLNTIRRQLGRPLDLPVIYQGTARERRLHAFQQLLFRQDQPRVRFEALQQIGAFGFAQRVHYYWDIGCHVALDAWDGEAELVHRRDIFRVREQRAMGVGRVLELAERQAFGRMTDHHRRFLAAETIGRQAIGVRQLADVLAIHLDDVPAQRKPVVQVRRRHHFGDRSVDAEVVVVQTIRFRTARAEATLRAS